MERTRNQLLQADQSPKSRVGLRNTSRMTPGRGTRSSLGSHGKITPRANMKFMKFRRRSLGVGGGQVGERKRRADGNIFLGFMIAILSGSFARVLTYVLVTRVPKPERSLLQNAYLRIRTPTGSCCSPSMCRPSSSYHAFTEGCLGSMRTRRCPMFCP